MEKYFVIHNIEDNTYLKAMTGEVFTPNIKQAGTWPSESSALSWAKSITKKDIFLEIKPVYKEFYSNKNIKDQAQLEYERINTPDVPWDH